MRKTALKRGKGFRKANKDTPHPRPPLKRILEGKKVPGKRKTRSLAKLKHELDAVFSKYIRQKYSTDGICKCYTCPKKLPIARMQNGHFVPRQYLATRWDENNCRPQCVGCNIFGNGQLLDFEERLKNEIGDVIVDTIKVKRHQIVKLDRMSYELRIGYYKSLLEGKIASA